MLYLFTCDNRFLFQHFHRHNLTIVLLFHQHHFTKRATTNHMQEIKIVGVDPGQHFLTTLVILHALRTLHLIHILLVGVRQLIVQQLFIAAIALLARLESRRVLGDCHRQQRGLRHIRRDQHFRELSAFRVTHGECAADAFLIRGLVAVIVLMRDVKHKLQRDGRQGDRLNRLKIDATLAFTEIRRHQVVDGFISQQQDTVLLFAFTIDLDHFVGEFHNLRRRETIAEFVEHLLTEFVVLQV
mmetsp:Transcript_33673/g.54813  ORF Transcript_33673/g.54813 Transcript_33673/m.54813 type:complete len:242 (+) Transcript_33673:447-1172(+)